MKKEVIGVPLEKKGNKITKKITWTTGKPSQNVYLSSQNILPNRPNVKPELH